jgi:hypothetical protein
VVAANARHLDDRKRQREHTALAGAALDRDVAAKQAGEIT